MSSIESTVVKVVVDVSDKLSDRLSGQLRLVRSGFPTAETAELLQDIGTASETLLGYLESPDFAAVVTQVRVRRTAGPAVKEQVHEGLRLAGLPEEFLSRTTDAVHRVLLAVCDEIGSWLGGHGGRIDETDLLAAATTTSRMLTRLKSLTEFHRFAARMRGQVAALHDKIRLTHIGVSRAAGYEELYVRPTLSADETPKLGTPGDRTVVLGDPGAGKSTLAAKFAYDIACDAAGRVPFLVVLREFTSSFGEGGHDLVHYLEKLCLAPYNVNPPRDGVEYLLRTGRAVVVLDGLDELVQTELRRRVVALVEGFAHLYPLVPVLVTARKIGYDEAPLSDQLFARAQIEEFNDDQVAEYVHRWFALDDATSPAERERLDSSFMEDSAQIPELRGNPLLLTLLCAMYSSDRYLPRNLAQVYERCAVMLFEQWDARRGIPLPLRFHGRLRGAVQHLAWRMFTAPESGKPLPRTRIVAVLTSWLESKLDDHDEAMATAEQFVAFCTGRAWILTDVGMTGAEPQFGFTHRTFLEYFAAEHLVRTHRTAADLWQALRPHTDQWEVVAQIALQLYDRNVEDGVDELLTAAVDGGGLDFAARALRHMHPGTRVVRAITEAALRRSLDLPITERSALQVNAFHADKALFACLYESSPVNARIVEQTVTDSLSRLLEQGNEAAALFLDHHPEDPPDSGATWPEIRAALLAQHQDRVSGMRKNSAWGARGTLDEPAALHHVVKKFGAPALFASYSFYYSNLWSRSVAEELLTAAVKIPLADAEAIAASIAGHPTPWADDAWFERVQLGEGNTGTRRTDALTVLLGLPFAERVIRDGINTRWAPIPDVLMTGRRNWRGRYEAFRWLDRAALPSEVHTFLKRWVSCEISVRRSGPVQPPRYRAPH